MKRLVAIVVALALCAPLFAAEPISPPPNPVVGILILLMVHIVRIADAACGDPNISPRLRAALESAADDFTAILEEAGISVRRAVPGTRG